MFESPIIPKTKQDLNGDNFTVKECKFAVCGLFALSPLRMCLCLTLLYSSQNSSAKEKISVILGCIIKQCFFYIFYC